MGSGDLRHMEMKSDICRHLLLVYTMYIICTFLVAPVYIEIYVYIHISAKDRNDKKVRGRLSGALRDMEMRVMLTQRRPTFPDSDQHSSSSFSS